MAGASSHTIPFSKSQSKCWSLFIWKRAELLFLFVTLMLKFDSNVCAVTPKWTGVSEKSTDYTGYKLFTVLNI